VKIHIERFSREPIIEHYFPTDESFEGKSGEHVEPETETSDVDQSIVGGEIVEDVALGEGAEG
jgi:hypothetical protein